MKHFLILLLCIVACNTTQEKTDVKHEVKKQTVSENFEVFDKSFNSDTVFQLSRVKFPLEGESIDGFEKRKWSKDNWEYHKSSVFNQYAKEFKHSIHRSDTLVTEKLWIEDSGFSFERWFRLIDNKWYLVYCLDRNL